MSSIQCSFAFKGNMNEWAMDWNKTAFINIRIFLGLFNVLFLFFLFFLRYLSPESMGFLLFFILRNSRHLLHFCHGYNLTEPYLIHTYKEYTEFGSQAWNEAIFLIFFLLYRYVHPYTHIHTCILSLFTCIIM